MHKTLPTTSEALKAFGSTIREERKKRRLTQEELAELADVHATYVGKVERGVKNVSFDNILRLSKALDLTVAELMRRAGL